MKNQNFDWIWLKGHWYSKQLSLFWSNNPPLPPFLFIFLLIKTSSSVSKKYHAIVCLSRYHEDSFESIIALTSRYCVMRSTFCRVSSTMSTSFTGSSFNRFRIALGLNFDVLFLEAPFSYCFDVSEGEYCEIFLKWKF